MSRQQQHEMILEKTGPSGTEEWYCPTCGRRMLIDWKPKFEKTILNVGDDYAIHSGAKGGLRMGSVQAKPVDVVNQEDEPQPFNEDFRLTPWARWLDSVDFENLWDNKL